MTELSPPFIAFCTAFDSTRMSTRSNGASCRICPLAHQAKHDEQEAVDDGGADDDLFDDETARIPHGILISMEVANMGSDTLNGNETYRLQPTAVGKPRRGKEGRGIGGEEGQTRKPSGRLTLSE